MEYLMNEMSKNTQATEYLLSVQVAQGDKLESIHTQVKATNGRVTKLEGQVTNLQLFEAENLVTKKDIEQIVGVKNFVSKYVFSKGGIISVGIFIFGIYFTLTSEKAQEILLKFF